VAGTAKPEWQGRQRPARSLLMATQAEISALAAAFASGTILKKNLAEFRDIIIRLRRDPDFELRRFADEHKFDVRAYSRLVKLSRSLGPIKAAPKRRAPAPEKALEKQASLDYEKFPKDTWEQTRQVGQDIVARKGIAGKLDSELKKLKSIFNSGYDLEVMWCPNHVSHIKGRRLAGEVVNKVIRIYEEREPEAVETLWHEFVEFVLVNEFSVPYKRIVNSLITLLEDEAYQRREMVVKKLCAILNFERDTPDADRTFHS
jgi:hypothetical protein